MRPMLRPGLRHAWLSDDTLQVGVDVPTPLVVRGLPVLSHALLARLDGIRSSSDLVAGLVKEGLDPSGGLESHEVLDRLAALGALADGGASPRSTTLAALAVPGPGSPGPDELAARLLTTHVTLVGGGRLGGIIARALTGAGVGAVTVDDDRVVTPADLAPGGFTADQVGQRRAALSSDHRPRPLAGAQQHLVVVTDEADVSTTCQILNRERAPHLVVTCRELIGRIGPFVVPGETSCQLCLELSRRDRDQHYAAVWRQSLRQPQPECEPLLAGVTAHIAASHVVSWAAGVTPPSLDAVIEVVAPDATVARHRTQSHPECGCAWPGSAA